MEFSKKYDISMLYVEDDDETREGIAEALNMRVRELDLARDGMEGLTLYKKKKHDIVMTDIKMPVMNGLDMSREIKKINKKVPIIITTAYNDSELLIECIDIGVNQFIMKPIIIPKLVNAIEKCIKLMNQ